MKTSLLRGSNARAYLQYLKDIGIKFRLICSNYTIAMEAEGLEKKFVAAMQSKRTFAGYSKLKSNVKAKPVPDIKREEINYFLHNFSKSDFVGDVYNIDLKSAYATILFMDGYITVDCYNYLIKSSKQERLSSVGMLASRKKCFDFDNGRVIPDGFSEIVSPTSNFFFYAVKRTYEIMTTLKSLCGSDYLFTWVDGIYLKPNINSIAQCENYLNSINFGYTTEQLKDFDVELTDKCVKINFKKQNKKGVWEPKPFTLPLINTEFKKTVVEAILTMPVTQNKAINLNYTKRFPNKKQKTK